MITELVRPDFYICSPLIDANRHLEVRAIIAGNNPGRVFVDDYGMPRSGVVWLGNNDGFIFIGDATNVAFREQFPSFLDRVIIPEAKQQGVTWFEGLGNTPEWDETIKAMFEDRHLGSWNQKVYVLEELTYQQIREPIVAENYLITKISKPLFDSNFLQEKIAEFWPSQEAFLEQGIGYCAICDNEIVSVCFTAFLHDQTHAIDIETVPAHQGKKLAQKLARAFVKECFKKGIVPYWDCMEGNIPSVKMAESLGFVSLFNYKGFDFKL